MIAESPDWVNPSEEQDSLHLERQNQERPDIGQSRYLFGQKQLPVKGFGYAIQQHIEEKSIIIKSDLMQNEELDDVEKVPVYNAIEETFGGKQKDLISFTAKAIQRTRVFLLQSDLQSPSISTIRMFKDRMVKNV